MSNSKVIEDDSDIELKTKQIVPKNKLIDDTPTQDLEMEDI